MRGEMALGVCDSADPGLVCTQQAMWLELCLHASYYRQYVLARAYFSPFDP